MSDIQNRRIGTSTLSVAPLALGGNVFGWTADETVSFNLLDAFVNAHFDDRFQFKVGRMLTPFLYEYYGFSPAWEPVITNSPMFQLAEWVEAFPVTAEEVETAAPKKPRAKPKAPAGPPGGIAPSASR